MSGPSGMVARTIIQILAFSSGEHSSMGSAFLILSFLEPTE